MNSDLRVTFNRAVGDVLQDLTIESLTRLKDILFEQGAKERTYNPTAAQTAIDLGYAIEEVLKR